jgi:tyrosyl-tRNA synthetase
MDKIEELLTRGVDKIYPSKEALEKVLRSGKKLRLYQGFDPSGIQLHIGHMTGLMKLRQFQELGHHVIFLIGDGTGQAGDPSGKTRTRKKFLTLEELRNNSKDYVLQAAKIVRFDGPNAAEILYNSAWLNKLNLVDILNIAGHFSLQQLEERDLYMERKKLGAEINFREFLYPLLQGYDSVAMKVDLELGGSDQTFNMLSGRKLVREMLNKEKFVMTTPLLTDTSGNKIGKTEGNVIALTSKPADFYGMIMNLPDNVIIKCFELITDIPIEDIKKYEADIKRDVNPMIYKKKLALKLTAMLNSEEEARRAQEYFERTFQKKELPDEIPTVKINVSENINVTDVLTNIKLVKSKSELKRLILGGAVEIDGNKIDPQKQIKAEDGMIIRVGKHRFIKIIK